MNTVQDFIFVLNNLHLPWPRHGYGEGPGEFWVVCSHRVGARWDMNKPKKNVRCLYTAPAQTRTVDRKLERKPNVKCTFNP